MRRCAALFLLGAVGCSDSGQSNRLDAEVTLDAAADAEVVQPDMTPDLEPDGPVECFGTIYPGIDPIDPDAPIYSDADWTQEQVTVAFDDAKAGNTLAYRAYKAAYELGDILECAFCACGCASLVDHVSAMDCFKDMHGFT